MLTNIRVRRRDGAVLIGNRQVGCVDRQDGAWYAWTCVTVSSHNPAGLVPVSRRGNAIRFNKRIEAVEAIERRMS